MLEEETILLLVSEEQEENKKGLVKLLQYSPETMEEAILLSNLVKPILQTGNKGSVLLAQNVFKRFQQLFPEIDQSVFSKENEIAATVSKPVKKKKLETIYLDDDCETGFIPSLIYSLKTVQELIKNFIYSATGTFFDSRVKSKNCSVKKLEVVNLDYSFSDFFWLLICNKAIMLVFGIIVGSFIGYYSAHHFALWGGLALYGQPYSPARQSLVPGHMLFFGAIVGCASYYIAGYLNDDNDR